MPWIVFIVFGLLRERSVHRGEFCGHVRHFDRGCVAWTMDEASDRHGGVCPATLMIDAEGVGSSERGGNAVVNKERERSSQAGDAKAVLARRFKFGKVSLKHSL